MRFLRKWEGSWWRDGPRWEGVHRSCQGRRERGVDVDNLDSGGWGVGGENDLPKN